MLNQLTILFALLHGGLLAAAWCASRRLAARPPHMQAPESWPPVRVIVPLAGPSLSLGHTIEDLCAQTGPDFEIVLSCMEDDTEACAAAVRFSREHPAPGQPAIRCVRAKDPGTCSRKNANLLAAIGTDGPESQILVFTDAGYRRPADWLEKLTAPIAAGCAQVTSSYYAALPGDTIRSALRPVTALCLLLVQQFPSLRQPWGGSTAIPRSLFNELKIADLWHTRIVDDVVLSARLRSAGIPVFLVPGPLLTAPPPTAGFSWSDWFVRQLAYIRFIQPVTWIGLGAGLLLLSGGIAWMALMLVCASGAACWIAAVDLVLLGGFDLRLASAHPQPGNRIRWLTACGVVFLGLPFCWVRASLGRTVRWREFAYRVGAGGLVLDRE